MKRLTLISLILLAPVICFSETKVIPKDGNQNKEKIIYTKESFEKPIQVQDITDKKPWYSVWVSPSALSAYIALATLFYVIVPNLIRTKLKITINNGPPDCHNGVDPLL